MSLREVNDDNPPSIVDSSTHNNISSAATNEEKTIDHDTTTNKDSSSTPPPPRPIVDWENPPLFKPDKIRVQAYWGVMSLVAPCRDETKTWKTTDAIHAYCTKCKIPIPWSMKNPKPVQRHMQKFHSDIIHRTKKRKESSSTTTNPPAAAKEEESATPKTCLQKNQHQNLTNLIDGGSSDLLLECVKQITTMNETLPERVTKQQKQDATNAWDNKDKEQRYKMNLLRRVKELRQEFRMKDEEIIEFLPEAEGVLKFVKH